MKKTTRRNFLKRSAQGVTVSAFFTPGIESLVSADSGGGETDSKIMLGMASYTFREFTLEDTLVMTKRLGLGRICLKDFHLPMDSTPEKIKAVAVRVKDYGLNLYGCGVVYMKNETEVHRAFDYAQTAGMKVIIGVPNHELLDLVNQKVGEYNIQVAIHNHGPGDKLYPTPQSAYEKIQNLDPRIGLCVDVGHTLRSGVNPAKVIQTHADRVLDVHLKDVTAATKAGTPIEIGRGEVDIPSVCRALLNIGYSGTASFEYEKSGRDPLPGASESVGYIRGVLATLQEGK